MKKISMYVALSSAIFSATASAASIDLMTDVMSVTNLVRSEGYECYKEQSYGERSMCHRIVSGNTYTIDIEDQRRNGEVKVTFMFQTGTEVGPTHGPDPEKLEAFVLDVLRNKIGFDGALDWSLSKNGKRRFLKFSVQQANTCSIVEAGVSDHHSAVYHTETDCDTARKMAPLIAIK